MNRFNLFFVISFLLYWSCSDNKPIYLNEQLGSFDVKTNDIVFTYFQKNIGSIYLNSLTKNSVKRITNPVSGWDEFPRFSNDGKKVLYFCYPNLNGKKFCINIVDLESNKVDTLVKGEPLVIDACFSKSGNFIYYLKASEFKNYSPIAKELPHGVDVFEININTKRQRQITHLKEYMMQAITQTYSDSLIGINIPNAVNEMGMGIISLTDGKFKRYIFQNDPRYQVKSWYFPIAICKDSLIYSAPYEIYIHNFKENRSNFLFRNPDNSNFGTIRIDENWENLYFSLQTGIFKYNIGSKDLIKLNLKITN